MSSQLPKEPFENKGHERCSCYPPSLGKSDLNRRSTDRRSVARRHALPSWASIASTSVAPPPKLYRCGSRHQAAALRLRFRWPDLFSGCAASTDGKCAATRAAAGAVTTTSQARAATMKATAATRRACAVCGSAEVDPGCNDIRLCDTGCTPMLLQPPSESSAPRCCRPAAIVAHACSTVARGTAPRAVGCCRPAALGAPATIEHTPGSSSTRL